MSVTKKSLKLEDVPDVGTSKVEKASVIFTKAATGQEQVVLVLMVQL